MPTVNQETTKAVASYTPFHPRWYRPHVSVYWWLGEWHYLKFILRELSSVFVAVFVIETLFMLNALRNGPEAYAHFQQCMRNPLLIVLNVVSFFFVVFHAITWFNLAPSAMPVRVRGSGSGVPGRGAELRRMGRGVRIRMLVGIALTLEAGHGKTVERGFFLDAVQRWRSGRGAADSGATLPVLHRISAGVVAGARLRAFAVSGPDAFGADLSVRFVLAAIVSLGAPLSLHTV